MTFGRGNSLFGFFQGVTSQPLNHVAVICNTIGFESVRLDKSVRHLANSLADSHCASLRFDFSCTGDSGGDDASNAEVWLDDIVEAVNEARRLSGCSRVILIGFRLGGLLTRIAAANLHIHGLILIQPHVSGVEAIREMQIMHASASRQAHDPTRSDGIQAGGFWFSKRLTDSLETWDLVRSARESDVPTLLLESEVRGRTGQVRRALEKNLRSLACDTFDGYAEMLLPPRRSMVSADLANRVCRWIEALPTDPVSLDKTAAEFPDSSNHGLVTGTAGVVERPILFGPENGLFGILSMLEDERLRTKCGVILVCGGAVHRVSANRMYVRLARKLASMGLAVLRFDLSGIGDSASIADSPRDHAYRAEFDENMRAARDLLGREASASATSYIGLCSGAFVAMRAALSDDSAKIFVSLNQLVYFLSAKKLDRASKSFPQNTRALDYPASTSRMNRLVRKAALKIDRFAPGKATWLSMRLLGGHLPFLINRLSEKLETVAFGVSQSDVASEILSLFGGREIGCSKTVTVRCFEEADHIFTLKKDQEDLIDWLIEIHAPYARQD